MTQLIPVSIRTMNGANVYQPSNNRDPIEQDAIEQQGRPPITLVYFGDSDDPGEMLRDSEWREMYGLTCGEGYVKR